MSARAIVAAVLCSAVGFAVGVAVGGDKPEPTPPTVLGEADAAFARQMSAHHQQAITMVQMLGPEAAPDVRALAEQIRSAQWREIGTLTGWLELAGSPQSPESDGHRHDGTGGMATGAELTRLAGSAGVERDVLFLQLMIRHHQGGIEMAAETARTTDLPAVRTRAVAMIEDQRQELTLMTVSLDARAASVLPYP